MCIWYQNWPLLSTISQKIDTINVFVFCDTARILIYTYSIDAFKRLEQKKAEIEYLFGYALDWHSSISSSVQKRIIYSRDIDIFTTEKQTECYDWFIDRFDKLKLALDTCDL